MEGFDYGEFLAGVHRGIRMEYKYKGVGIRKKSLLKYSAKKIQSSLFELMEYIFSSYVNYRKDPDLSG